MRQPQSASFHIADGNLILAIEQSDDGVELKVLDTHIKHDITHRVWGGTLDDLSVILEEWSERHQADAGPQAPKHILQGAGVGQRYEGEDD